MNEFPQNLVEGMGQGKTLKKLDKGKKPQILWPLFPNNAQVLDLNVFI